MNNAVWTLQILSHVALLLMSTASWALAEDACSQGAVLRTTKSNDFTLIGDGSIVRHDTTGLEWKRCAVGQTWSGSTCTGSASIYIWQEALQVADAAGEGWRLPNVNELRSIVEECRSNPAINRVVFPNTDPLFFWSASPDAIASDGAWYVSFSNGNDFWRPKGNGYRVRLVRGAY